MSVVHDNSCAVLLEPVHVSVQTAKHGCISGGDVSTLTLGECAACSRGYSLELVQDITIFFPNEEPDDWPALHQF